MCLHLQDRHHKEEKHFWFTYILPNYHLKYNIVIYDQIPQFFVIHLFYLRNVYISTDEIAGVKIQNNFPHWFIQLILQFRIYKNRIIKIVLQEMNRSLYIIFIKKSFFSWYMYIMCIWKVKLFIYFFIACLSIVSPHKILCFSIKIFIMYMYISVLYKHISGKKNTNSYPIFKANSVCFEFKQWITSDRISSFFSDWGYFCFLHRLRADDTSEQFEYFYNNMNKHINFL